MFRRRFWSSLVLTIPLAVTSEMVMDARLADLETNPEAGRPWEEVERDLRAGLA